MELAIWFHDVIYDAGAKDNEELSASLAKQTLAATGRLPSLGNLVSALILATRHETICNATTEEMLLVDIDLSILGATPSRYFEYELKSAPNTVGFLKVSFARNAQKSSSAFWQELQYTKCYESKPCSKTALDEILRQPLKRWRADLR